MKRIRDRKLTPLLKDQLATQEIRINEAGNNAYQDYIKPIAMSAMTLYSIRRGSSEMYLKLPGFKDYKHI